MSISDIVMILVVVWFFCMVAGSIIYIANEDDDEGCVDFSVIVVFPSNLIYVLKFWWKSIIRAIKS